MSASAAAGVGRPTHLSLFSGIGGIDLAAEWAGFRTIAFCERDDFCRDVLAAHWPGVPIYGDITDLPDSVVAGLGPIDLLSGGFPCQPFSAAGKRLGKADDRYLWPEMLRIIAAARPRWVCAENVDDIVRMVLARCLSDLEALGYTGGAVVLPALAVGAPHYRERCFFVAHDDVATTSARSHADAARLVGQEWRRNIAHWQTPISPEHPEGGVGSPPVHGRGDHRVADGLPGRLDAAHYGRRVRALGNAVVPAQIYPVLAAIAREIAS